MSERGETGSKLFAREDSINVLTCPRISNQIDLEITTHRM